MIINSLAKIPMRKDFRIYGKAKIILTIAVNFCDSGELFINIFSLAHLFCYTYSLSKILKNPNNKFEDNSKYY